MKRLPLSIAFLMALVASVILAPAASAVGLSTFSSYTASVAGGTTISTTFRLTSAAPSGGQQVTFTASNSYATAPAPVTIAAGRSSGSARFTTRAVDRDISVTLTATADGVAMTFAVVLTPARLSTLSTTPNLVAGSSGTGTVSLDAYAQSPLVVSLSSDDTGVATVPSSVTVPAGKRSATFPVSSTVSSRGTATITAVANGVTKTDTTRVDATQLYSLSLPSTIVNAGTSTARVRLTGAAPTGGIVVALSMPAGSPLTIPNSVTVPAGKLDVSFSVTGSAVSAASPVTVTARYLSTTKTDTVNVLPPPAVVREVVLEADVSLPNTFLLATVLLDKPTAVAMSVRITSSSTTVQVPYSVRVPAGYIGAVFPVVVGNATSNQTVMITARAGVVQDTAWLSIQRNLVQRLTLGYDTSVQGGQATDAYVFMQLPYSFTQGSISVVSSNPTVLSVPASVSAPNLTTFGIRIPITTRAVQQETTVTVTARYGSSSQTLAVLVTPELRVSQLAFSPRPAVDGVKQATFELNGAAPAGGATVTVTSSDPTRVPSTTVQVPAGGREIEFGLQTYGLADPAEVTVSLTLNGSSLSQPLTVGALLVEELTFANSRVVGGAAGEGTIRISNPAPAGGTVVAITSSVPSIQPAASVTIPAGSTTATFAITTTQVETAVSGRILASLNGRTVEGIFRVEPIGVASLTLSAGEARSGDTVTATITLDQMPTALPVVVTVGTWAPISGPATVSVPVGQTTATFTLTIGTVTEERWLTTSVQAGASREGAELHLLPDALGGASVEDPSTPAPTEEPTPVTTPEPTATPETTQEPTVEATPELTVEPTPQPTVEPTVEVTPEPVVTEEPATGETPVVEEPSEDQPAA